MHIAYILGEEQLRPMVMTTAKTTILRIAVSEAEIGQVVHFGWSHFLSNLLLLFICTMQRNFERISNKLGPIHNRRKTF